jgi:hypothetical protein
MYILYQIYLIISTTIKRKTERKKETDRQRVVRGIEHSRISLIRPDEKPSWISYNHLLLAAWWNKHASLGERDSIHV